MNRMLAALAMCLGLAHAALAEEIDTSQVQVQVLAKSGSSWDNQTLPPYPSTAPEISVLRISIPPGTSLPLHKHPMINAGVLLSGSLTVVTENGQTLHMKSGDALIEVVDTWHYGRNDGSETAVIVVFYAGTRDMPVSIKR